MSVHIFACKCLAGWCKLQKPWWQSRQVVQAPPTFQSKTNQSYIYTNYLAHTCFGNEKLWRPLKVKVFFTRYICNGRFTSKIEENDPNCFSILGPPPYSFGQNWVPGALQMPYVHCATLSTQKRCILVHFGTFGPKCRSLIISANLWYSLRR